MTDLDALLGATVRALLDEAPPVRAALLATEVAAVLAADCLIVRPVGGRLSEVQVVAAAGRPAELAGRRLALEAGPIERSLGEGRPAERIGSGRAKGLFGRHDRLYGAWRIEPCAAGGGTAGLLIAIRASSPAFTPDERLLLAALAHLLPLVLVEQAAAPAEARPAQPRRPSGGAGHELRTPLTAVSAALSLINDGAYGTPPDAMRRPLEMAAARTAELAVAIEDLLGRQAQPPL